jgi:peptidoglycan/xylan/chitin deacetylase (PgdA/CDA1 family)
MSADHAGNTGVPVAPPLDPAGRCALTFDDGPDPQWTPRVLAELARWDVRATFFVLASRVREAPRLVREIVDAGHEVELHGDRHVRHTALSLREIELDTRTALSVLGDLGIAPRRWRTPWGVCTRASEHVASRHGLELVGWTVDTHDWRGDSSQLMLARARGRVGDGAVVLMHDALGPGARRAGCASTVELIGALTLVARKRAIRPVPLSALPACCV